MPERSSHNPSYTTQQAYDSFDVCHPGISNEDGLSLLAVFANDLAAVAPDGQAPENEEQAVAKMTKGALRMVIAASGLDDPRDIKGPHFVLDDSVHASSADFFHQVINRFGSNVPDIIGAVSFGDLQVRREDTLYPFMPSHPKYGHLAGCTQIINYHFEPVDQV